MDQETIVLGTVQKAEQRLSLPQRVYKQQQMDNYKDGEQMENYKETRKGARIICGYYM